MTKPFAYILYLTSAIGTIQAFIGKQETLLSFKYSLFQGDKRRSWSRRRGNGLGSKTWHNKNISITPLIANNTSDCHLQLQINQPLPPKNIPFILVNFDIQQQFTIFFLKLYYYIEVYIHDQESSLVWILNIDWLRKYQRMIFEKQS